MPEFRDEVRKRLEHLRLEPSREAGIVEEVAQHLEDRFQDLRAQGSTSRQARDAVLRELNRNDLLARRLSRVVRREDSDAPALGAPGSGSLLANLAKDLHYSARALRRNSGFALVAILSLALGMGANTAIFQMLDAVRLRTLPVKDPNELYEVRIPNLKGRQGHFNGDREVLSNPLWELIRDQQQAFSGILAWSNAKFNLATGGEARRAQGIYVSGDFFNVLGVRPLLGRVFTAADDQHGCGSPGAVISYAFWQREFGAESSAVGNILRLEGHPVTIVGVTPANFFGMDVGRSYDVAIPLCAEQLILGEKSVFSRRDGWWLAAIGRLKPGWTPAKATAQLESISPGIFQATLPASYNPETAKKYLAAKLGVLPAGSGTSNLREEYENPLWLLLAIAGTVLLIACANLANLTFARASSREHEIAVRLALGASRLRLLQHLLAESVLLAVTGAAAGALLAQILTRMLISFLSTQASEVFLDLGLDWRVFAFTGALTAITCVLFGLAPALRAARTPPAGAMKAGSRGDSGTRRRFGARRALVVTQVGLSLVLLVGAFLFVQTFQNLVTLDAGFRQSGLLVTQLDLSPLKLPLQNRAAFKKGLLERVRAIPGVESAAETSIVPATGNWWNDTVHTGASGHEVRQSAFFNLVSPGFFQTMGTPLVEGRDLTDADSLTSPAVAVVNQTFVHKFLPGTDPLGKTFRVEVAPGKPEPQYEIVGIVKDTKYLALRESPQPIVYLPTGQDKDPDLQTALVVRSDLSLDALRVSLDRTIHEVNPAIAFQFSVFKTQVRDMLVRERLMASLSGFFGFLAALLATIGLYGVISYMVVRRRNEIGIRMALGANRGRVLALVMREAAILLAIGLSIGAALAWIAAKAAGSLLFGLSARDPGTMALAAASLGAIALAASYLPAHRAAGLDPLEALRDE
jgi:predicted permease